MQPQLYKKKLFLDGILGLYMPQMIDSMDFWSCTSTNMSFIPFQFSFLPRTSSTFPRHMAWSSFQQLH